MNATVKTNAFKSGNSVAVRLPKRYGVKPGDALELEHDGLNISIRIERDPAEDKRELLRLLEDLEAIGRPADGVQARPEFEMPERPGL